MRGWTSAHCAGGSLMRTSMAFSSAFDTRRATLSRSPALHGSRASPEEPVYYNFRNLHVNPMAANTATQTHSTGSGNPPRRTRRLSSVASAHAHLHAEDRMPLENTMPVVEDDPYKHLRIFRRDMIDSHSGRHFTLSVDVPLKKFIDMFCDFEGKRCKLCSETFLQWHSHQAAIPHSGREGLMLEMLRAYCGTPEEILRMWWYRLNTSPAFPRIRALSHDNSHIRKRRLQFLLRFLTDRRIIKDTFNVVQAAAAGAGRSWEFERLEWVGDNVVKYVFNNRLNCIFPVREGGVRGRLGYAQFMIDGNEGLARAYDYLELQQLTKSDRVVSKFKSDVVETLFGELQLYLWSTQIDGGTEYYEMPFGKDMHSVRQLVAHTMEELGHVMFMYHAEYLHGCIQRIMRENQLQFVRADPALRHQSSDLSAGDLAASAYATRSSQPHPRAGGRLSETRIPYSSHSRAAHPHTPHHGQGYMGGGGSGSALFMESTDYDAFRRVVPLGGLLPRPFAVSELAPTPAFMPHLQLSRARLASSLRGTGMLAELLSRTETMAANGSERESTMETVTEAGKGTRTSTAASVNTHAFYTLSSERTPRRGEVNSWCSHSSGATPAPLGVPELKDEDLIPELL